MFFFVAKSKATVAVLWYKLKSNIANDAHLSM